MEANMSAYQPFGDEWQAEMMKMPKKHLIEMLKTALINGVEVREGICCEGCGEELAVDNIPREIHFFCSAECQNNFEL
jgi:hypothetical protein